MATIVQRRRGTTAQHAAFTGALGEITIDTDKDVAVIHDGVTAGGFPMAGTMFANIFQQPQTVSLPVGSPTVAALSLITDSISRVTFRQDGVGILHRQEADIVLSSLDITKRGTTGDALAALSLGSGIGGFNFKGWDGAALSGTAASIRVFTTEAWSPVAHGTRILFITTATGTTTATTTATLTSSAFTLAVPLDMGTNLINNVVNPVAAQDAATKSYVDGLISAGAPPFIDSTALVKGSADATKLLRFEVDGFTTATTRVLTPPNADITLAGINIAQTFAEDQTFGKRVLLPNTTSATVGGILFGGTLAVHNFGTNNTFVGVGSGNLTLTGTLNSCLGTFTGGILSSGSNNAFFGSSAGGSTTTGNSNCFFGYFAGVFNSTASSNCFFGRESGFANTDGADNSFFGRGSGITNVTGDRNCFFGRSAGNLSTGDNNLLIGYSAGDNLSSGSNNLIIGYDIDVPSATGSNLMSIGNLIFGTAIDGTGTTISTGNIGIRTTAPESALDINSVTGNNLQLTYNDSNGAAANKVNFALSSTGDLTITPSGGDVSLAATVLQITNGTDPGADPTNATKQWAVGGEWQYRSSAASEGAGQTNRVHNRAAQVIGAGTSYTLTTSAARVDFGTTDPEIVLPTAGTYLLFAQALYVSDALGASDIVQFQLRNSTDSVFVGAPVNTQAGVASGQESGFPSCILTVSASKTIQLWAFNSVSARGTIASAATLLYYVRLF